MRVVAGKFGSRPLKSLRGQALRPTSDRLRETLFNILWPSVEGSVFVDAYAGTGAVGIEALSRGAGEVVFIENHPAAVELIRKNLRSLGVEPMASPFRVGRGDAPRVEIIAADAVKALETLQARRFVADFYYVDPPYAEVQEYQRALDALGGAHLLARTGRVIVESLRTAARGWELPERAGDLELARVVEQGDAALYFYRLALAA